MKIPKSGNKLKELKAQRKAAASALPPPRVKRLDEDTDDEEEEDSDEELATRMRRGMGISVPGSDESPRTRILSVLELEELFLQHAPEGVSDPSLESHPEAAVLTPALFQFHSLRVTVARSSSSA